MPVPWPIMAVIVFNSLAIAAQLCGGIFLWRTGRSQTALVVAGVFYGVAFEIAAASAAIFFPVNSWTWAAIKVTGRLVELASAVRFLLHLSEKAQNGGLKVG